MNSDKKRIDEEEYVPVATMSDTNVTSVDGDKDNDDEKRGLIGDAESPMTNPVLEEKVEGVNFQEVLKFLFCFCGLQVSYITWGYMQELIMTSVFLPTKSSPDGRFPSAAFCVFSNRFLAIIVAMISVKIRHGAILANNVAPSERLRLAP